VDGGFLTRTEVFLTQTAVFLTQTPVFLTRTSILQEPGCNAERLQWERVIKYDPEVLVLVPCSSNPDRSLSEVEYVASIPGFWNLTAVQNRQVFICEHSFFSRPGPRYEVPPLVTPLV
jgi:ABC-type Fe3+-hydroxamate transport system substrate-binding protein